MILKAVAAGLSGSLSVVSSLVDSVMDLISGIIIWATSSAMRRKMPYKYPLGKVHNKRLHACKSRTTVKLRDFYIP